MKQELIKESVRFQKLAGILKEDETQDKLDDLSTAFKTDSVPAYVTLLQQYSKDPKIMAVLKAGQTDGQPNDEKFSVASTLIAAKDLKPTQNEIGLNLFKGVVFNLNDLITGTYILKIESPKFVDAIKFIKAN